MAAEPRGFARRGPSNKHPKAGGLFLDPSRDVARDAVNALMGHRALADGSVGADLEAQRRRNARV